MTKHLNINELEDQFYDLEDVKDKPKTYSAIEITCPTAASPANEDKNRYSNILPNEEGRVILNPTWRTRTNNYINASYCGDTEEGTKAHRWIATQCPLPSTFDDFWQMVWEQRSGVIVTLLKLFENGYKKGDMYWPNRMGLSNVWGGITITLVSQTPGNQETITRRFSLTHNTTGETRRVTQLQFMGWPDFGTPSDARSIVALYNLTELYREESKVINLNGPVITHCSAGVGRAGTFISSAIAMAKIARFEKKIDSLDFSNTASSEDFATCFTESLNRIINVPDIITMLRRQRSWAMVQTLGQFIFIYKVILASLQERLRIKAAKSNFSTYKPQRTLKTRRRHCPYERKRL